MREARVTFIKVPLEERINFLVEEYGNLDKEFLKDCTQKIWKRLGPEQTKSAVLAIDEGRMADFIRIALVYYDKTYLKSLNKRRPENIAEIELPGNNAAANADLVLASQHKLVDLQ